MKTRNIIAILAALPIMAGFTGCKSDDELSAKPAKEMLQVLSGNVIEYRANEEGPATGVNISADCRWTVEVDNGNFGEDISVQPRQGNGNGTLVITSNQNTDPNVVREAYITLVSDGGLRQKVTVRQKGGDEALNISRGSFSFEADPQSSQLLTITSNRSWTITAPSVAWLHLSKTSGNAGAETVEISVDQSFTDATRSASFVVSYGSNSAEVTVSQAGMDFNDIFIRASQELLTFGESGGSQAVHVESNAQWKAYKPTSATWLHINQADTLAINGDIVISADPNTTGRDRLSAVVLLAGTKNPQQAIILVEQRTQNAELHITVGELTSLYVGNENAEFRFSFVSDEQVVDYGLVYSTTEREPTRDNAEVVTVGQGGTGGSVMGVLSNLQPTTTYYVRGYVLGTTLGFHYTNVVTITTSSSAVIPGESDNPSPQPVARRQ